MDIVEQIWQEAEALYHAKKALAKAPGLKEFIFLADDRLQDCGKKLGVDFEAEFDKMTAAEERSTRIAEALKNCFILTLFIAFMLSVWL